MDPAGFPHATFLTRTRLVQCGSYPIRNQPPCQLWQGSNVGGTLWRDRLSGSAESDRYPGWLQNRRTGPVSGLKTSGAP
jgi:hypothetical protein